MAHMMVHWMPKIEPEPSDGDQVRIAVGDLAAHQQGRDAIGDLHHGQRHDEGGNADPVTPKAVTQAEAQAR